MGLSITGSVGSGGTNAGTDVAVIQTLLNRAGASLVVDRSCGPLTIGAIKSFQSRFLPNPDGRVDVGGRSWRALLDAPPASNQSSLATAKRNELVSWIRVPLFQCCNGEREKTQVFTGWIL